MTTAKKSLKGVEIFRAGTWKGKPYTVADLDDMISNFKRFQSPTSTDRMQRAPVVVGHDQKEIANSSVAKRGDIVNLWRDGDILKTDAADLDEDLAAAIQNGHYDDVSAEIYDEPPEGIRERGAKGKMLRRLAILGGDIPHIKNLNRGGLGVLAFGEPTLRITRTSRPARGTAYQTFSEEVAMTREEMIAALVAAGGEAEVVNSFSDQQLAVAFKLKSEPAASGSLGTPIPATFSETQIADIVGKVAERVIEPIAAKLAAPIAAKIDERLAANADEMKRSRVATFCETELRAGRIDPADMDATAGPTLADRLMKLDDSAKVHTFTEGGNKRELTQLDAEMRAIRLRTPRYGDNGKKIGSGKAGAATFSESATAVTKERFQAFAESPDIAAEMKKTGQTPKDVVSAWELASEEDKRSLEAALGFAA